MRQTALLRPGDDRRLFRAPENALELAAAEPGRRVEILRRLLDAVNRWLPARGNALIRPSPDPGAPYRVDYAGAHSREMECWIRARLEPSLEYEAPLLGTDAPCSPGFPPEVFRLYPASAGLRGLWLVWPGGQRDLGAPDTRVPGVYGGETEGVERLRRGLESLVEVEHREPAYFAGVPGGLGDDLARAVREGDCEAVPALLSFVRSMEEADLAYWGTVRDGVVDVERHLGAEDRGFGFELPLGQGVGGRAFETFWVLETPDYLNCEYRYPGVSDVTDSERVRSVLAVPVRGSVEGSGAVLYAGRRSVAPFSLAERALLRRLGTSVEPVPGARTGGHFFPRRQTPLARFRSELRQILSASDQIQEVEGWLERVAGGHAVVSDHLGNPYVARKAPRLESLMRDPAARAVPLGGARSSGGRGHLYLLPTGDLSPPEWPDLLEDAVAACNLLLERAEQAHDRLYRSRSHWLSGIMEGKAGPRHRKEGNRLGLPVDRGEVWGVAWQPRDEGRQDTLRRQMLAEDTALDLLGAPLISPDSGLGLMLLKDRPGKSPGTVRDGLLGVLGPGCLWLVHSAAYTSFEELRDQLVLVSRTVGKLRDAASEHYISEAGGEGLERLIHNPRLSPDLEDFADNLLSPLEAHDRKAGSHLTETFCRTLTLGSPAEAARHLFVHPNTVRYRLRRAETLLATDLENPRHRTALSLAAFVWLHRTPATNQDP